MEVLSNELLPDGRVKVVTRQVPGIKLPRVVRPVLRGKEVEFRDTRTYVEAEKGKFPFTQTFHTVNNITDRAVVEGTITVSQDTDARTKLHVEGECVVKITGLGGKIESIIAENLMRSYRRLPDIVAEWMIMREAMLANPQPRAPPAVRAPTAAGDDGDDESFSPTESDAGSTSSFLSAESDPGLRLGRVGGVVVGERDQRAGKGGREETAEPGRCEVAAAVSHRAGHAAAGQVPRQVQNRGGGGVREPERRKRRRKERHRQRGRERGTAGRSRRRGAGKVLGRNVARAGRRVRLLAPRVLLLQGEALLSDADSDSERGGGSPDQSGSDGYVSGRDGEFEGAPDSILTPAHARGEEQEADAAEGRPVIDSGMACAALRLDFVYERVGSNERTVRPFSGCVGRAFPGYPPTCSLNASHCAALTPDVPFCSSHRTFPEHGGVVSDPVHSQNPALESYKEPRFTRTFSRPPSAAILASSLVTSAFAGESASACLKSTPRTATSPAGIRGPCASPSRWRRRPRCSPRGCESAESRSRTARRRGRRPQRRWRGRSPRSWACRASGTPRA